jgi:hypothetical protein
MGALLAAGLRATTWAHARRVDRAAADPARVQAAALETLLRRNARTAFGREHEFGGIRTPAEYRRAVPVRDYEGFRPYVRRIVAGEPAVLTAEPVIAFATTSGTTAEPKLVPVTAAWLARMAAFVRFWMRGAQRDHPALLRRALLSIVSPAVEGATPERVPYGALSGLLHCRLPAAVRRAQAVPYAVHLIPDPDARAFVLLRLALGQSVSAVATPNATTLVRLAQLARRHADTLLRAIHDGTLGMPWPALGAEPGLDAGAARRAIEEGLAPRPARARALARLAAARGELRLEDAWPDLALVGCWLGGSAGHHARRLAPDYGPVPLRDLGLVASEGRVTLPVADGTAAGPLALEAGFFEFVPEEAMDASAPPTLLAHELEVGCRYGVVLSGDNGLYRYDLNDVVEVQGFHRRTPLLAFVRKGRDMVSITGEKLHPNHVRAALDDAEAATRVDVWQYRLIPDVDGCRYDLLVEPVGVALDATAAEAFARAFDEGLGRANVEYAAKRRTRRLGAPRLAVMRGGWAEAQCRTEFARGRRDVQHKWRPLVTAWDPDSRAAVVRTWEETPE